MQGSTNNCFPAHWVLADTLLLSGLIWADFPTLWAAKSIHVLSFFCLIWDLVIRFSHRQDTSNPEAFGLPPRALKSPQTNLPPLRAWLPHSVNSTGVNPVPEICSSWAAKETHSVSFYYCLQIFAIPIYLSKSNKKYACADWLGHLFLL